MIERFFLDVSKEMVCNAIESQPVEGGESQIPENYLSMKALVFGRGLNASVFSVKCV